MYTQNVFSSSCLFKSNSISKETTKKKKRSSKRERGQENRFKRQGVGRNEGWKRE
uniref:Uncharacterized protein n=1 Tax=Octopus bimaculoides TaxID=37653 RepID=A0A0L8HLS1_OCTBM